MLFYRYLFTQFVSALIYQTCALTGIVYLIQSFRLFKWIALRQISLTEFFSLSVLMIPQFISYLMPFSCFFSIIYVLQQLKNRQELMAFSVLGVSNKIILRPIAWIVMGIVFFQLLLHMILPSSVSLFQKQEQEFLSRIDLKMLKPKQFNILNNTVIYIDRLVHRCGQLSAQNIFLYYELPNRQFFVTAQSGVIKTCGNKRIIQFNQGYQVQWHTKKMIKQDLKFQKLSYDLGVLKGRSLSAAEIVLAKKWRILYKEKTISSQAESFLRLSKIALPILGFVLLSLFFPYQRFFLLAIGCCVVNLSMIGLANILPLLIFH